MTRTPRHDYSLFGGFEKGVDGPEEQVDTATSTIHYTFTDHLGTPLLLTNADGTTYWRAEYEPYGAVYAPALPTCTSRCACRARKRSN